MNFQNSWIDAYPHYQLSPERNDLYIYFWEVVYGNIIAGAHRIVLFLFSEFYSVCFFGVAQQPIESIVQTTFFKFIIFLI